MLDGEVEWSTVDRFRCSLMFLPASSSWKWREQRRDERDDHEDDDNKIGDTDVDPAPVDVVAERIKRQERSNVQKRQDHPPVDLARAFHQHPAPV